MWFGCELLCGSLLLVGTAKAALDESYGYCLNACAGRRLLGSLTRLSRAPEPSLGRHSRRQYTLSRLCQSTLLAREGALGVMCPVEVGSLHDGAAQIGLLQIGTLQNGVTEIRSFQLGFM